MAAIIPTPWFLHTNLDKLLLRSIVWLLKITLVTKTGTLKFTVQLAIPAVQQICNTWSHILRKRCLMQLQKSCQMKILVRMRNLTVPGIYVSKLTNSILDFDKLKRQTSDIDKMNSKRVASLTKDVLFTLVESKDSNSTNRTKQRSVQLFRSLLGENV
ncbi:hypothetical protein MAR_002203 [Mya arenaria]|uniref:Uncharacterized protein n=1 Tax=Mya arenaria TaxID=6604 RepID=A0ABY7FDY3_MYAAR|nr:hypothetical protein MAR_002203 [Mya arenaria]